MSKYRIGDYLAEGVDLPGHSGPLFARVDVVRVADAAVGSAVREIIARLKWLEKTGNGPDDLPGLGDVIQEIRQVYGIAEDES